MDEKQADELVKKGYLYISVMFELVGNPKEHVKNALELVINKVKENENVEWVGHEIGEPEEAKDLWSSFCDAELLVKDLATLSWIGFNFAPASMEIIEPAELKFKDKELTDFFGDLLSQVHVMNGTLIEIKSQNKLLQRNINAVVRNGILISLANDEKTSEEISKLVGINEENLKPVFEAMIKEDKIELIDGKYKRK
ncbi:hypothetical protein K9L67_00255 [Candidatus Woesearchaeota archaeon]|nr:hypothetical protein [Candidatus Woesearchaeota archaeon]MCF7900638.1 hypothetical protein [Candidatus Woesearchaeota archaeon]MCF8013478.1 hypothetical protein [Candidatus Woesearchaeota archaeon]